MARGLMARRLIVNADDFNLTPGVSRGIVEGHRQGIVTSTTAMVNLPGLRDNASALREAPQLSVGLHVNLTLGTPVLPADRVASLVDPDGCFPRDPERFAGSGAPGEIRAELQAQAARFEAVLGRTPSHIDSHHHVHRHPRVLSAVLELAATLRVPVRTVSKAMRAAIRAQGLRCPDRLVGDVAREAYWTVERIAAMVADLPEGVTEACTHPGRWDPTLEISSYARPRETELQAFCDPAARAALTAANVTLISYFELLAG